MPVSRITELKAINSMLSVIGEAPVNQAENTGNVDAVMAKQILDEVSLDVQTRGWHFNTDRNFPLAPNTSGEITLSPDILAVDTVGADAGLDVVQRGARLYDAGNHTYFFSQPLKVDIIRLLSFNDLPPAAQNYITIRAARIFQDRVIGSQTLNGFNEKDELRAFVTLRNAEAEAGDYRVTNNTFVASMLRRF